MYSLVEPPDANRNNSIQEYYDRRKNQKVRWRMMERQQAVAGLNRSGHLGAMSNI